MKCVLLAPGSQNRTTIAKKSIQNTIIFMMRLGINFRTGFGGSSRPKWNQVGTKIDQKSMPIAKCDFLKNRALAAAWARIL